jgi:hypothetical protein
MYGKTKDATVRKQNSDIFGCRGRTRPPMVSLQPAQKGATIDTPHTLHGVGPQRPPKLNGFLGVFGGFSVYSILEDFGIWMLPKVIKVV